LACLAAFRRNFREKKAGYPAWLTAKKISLVELQRRLAGKGPDSPEPDFLHWLS